MFVPVGLSSFLHLLEVLLGVEVSCFARLGKEKTCRRCRKNDERSTGTNKTNLMGLRCNIKIKAIPILIVFENLIVNLQERNF